MASPDIANVSAITPSQCHRGPGGRRARRQRQAKSANADGRQKVLRSARAIEPRPSVFGSVSIIWRKRNQNAVDTEIQLIDQGGTEYMRLTQSDDLPFAFTSVAEAGNIRALRGLLAQIVLIHVIAMKRSRSLKLC